MRITKHLGILAIGLFASCAFFSCSPNVKEQETTKPETSYVLQYQKNKKIEEQKAWDTLSREGASIVKSYKERHDKSVDQTGVGIFYGLVSYYAIGLSNGLEPYKALRFEELRLGEWEDVRKAVLKESKNVRIKTFRPPTKTDCLEWCVLNLRKAYEKAGMAEEWEMTERTALDRSVKTPTSKFLKTNGTIGVELAKKLVEDGWTCIYYNPDTNLPGDKPAYIPEEPWDKKSLDYKIWWRRNMLWTEHPTSYDNVKKYGYYYGIPVTDLLVDYHPTTELTDEYAIVSRWMENKDLDKEDDYYKVPVTPHTIKKTDKIEQLKKEPFSFLLTRGGDHCAILSYGKVYEVHQSFGPQEKKLIEVKDFETKWDWLSGVIIVPPGSWKIK